MILEYTNSRNEKRTLHLTKTTFLNKTKISYSDISFQNHYPYFLKINGRIVQEYTKDKFLGEAEYFKVIDSPDKEEYMVFEINCISEYINVIMFYRFLDMLEKLIGINISKHLNFLSIYDYIDKYINCKSNCFLYYRDKILNGKIDWKDETNNLKVVIENNNKRGKLDAMLDVINSYLSNPTEVYYRGVGTPIYPEQPGIFRLHNGDNETKIFKDMIVRYPHVFKGNSTIESLTHMQHYELKTRLLDVTTNPLVALYMAVNKIYTGDPQQIDYGEVIVYFADVDSVKYYDSSKVLINSKLVFLSKNEKEYLLNFIKKLEGFSSDLFNDVESQIWLYEKNNRKLINEILDITTYDFTFDEVNNALESYFKLLSIVRQDNPSFVNRMDLRGLLKAYIVNVGYVNERIAAQSGGFIIFGLDKDYLTNIKEDINEVYSSRTYESFPRIIIKNKSKIYEELNAIGINDSTMIPDIEHASKFIIDKYR